MTSDFIDDLSIACEKEGCPYLLIVQDPNGQTAQVRSHLTNWNTLAERTVKEDILQMLDVTAFEGLP